MTLEPPPAGYGRDRTLPPFRWWQVFQRSLFHLRLPGSYGIDETWSVDIRHGGDDEGVVRAQLYRNGSYHTRSTVPAVFTVTGGVIEVAVSGYGVSRLHYVTPDGREYQLTPDPASAEGQRARLDRTHPAASRALATASVAVLAVSLLLGVPQLVEQITQIPPIADTIGTFVSPIQLPAALNIALVAAGIAASTERALRLRYSRILDGGLLDGGDD